MEQELPNFFVKWKNRKNMGNKYVIKVMIN